MRKYILCLLFPFLTTITIAQKNWLDPQITAKDIKAHIYYLASDEMKGRFTGSPEEIIAAEYIKEQLESYGLKPAFNGNFYQDFPFIEKIELTANNSVAFEINNQKKQLNVKEDFITISFSGNGKANGGLVFAGYGISSSKLNYDDYKDIDVKGKIVLAMRNHPEHDSLKSEFNSVSSLRQKAAVAREKGALALILVNGANTPNDEDQLMRLRYDGAPAMKDFPVINMKRVFVEELFKSQGLDFAEVQKQIDSQKKPSSFTFENISVSLQTEIEEFSNTARNVAGILEGNDPILKKEYIVIGGHYDHIGIDQLPSSSMYKGPEKLIHNGADDNASGTTGILELAEKFASMKDQLKRSFIFAAFSGEELGLLGSAYFVNNSPVPLENIITMLNMDMIGRLNPDNNLTVIGAGTSTKWNELLNNKNTYDFQLALSNSGSGGSDHQSFYNKNIPVMFFFTGTHEDYHRPSDDVDKINYTGQEKILHYIFDVAEEVNKFETKPDYVKVAEPTNRGMSRSRVTVGTVPEFSYNGSGYKLSGVTDGSPAAIAGLKAGDIIIKFGSKKVENIYDFMYATQEYKPGDTAEVVVLREGNEVKFNIELKAN